MAAPKKSTRTPKLKGKVKTRSKSLPSVPDKILPVVGIGALAGGLKAFEQFFAKMRADSGMAFVLIPHLDPTHAEAALSAESKTIPGNKRRHDRPI